MESHYKTLGINSSATQEEIRRAYRILARRYHPDVNPGKASEERFKTISRAYETLSDAEKRRNYDIELEQNSQRANATGFEAYQRATRAAQQRRRSAAGQSQTTPNREPPKGSRPEKKQGGAGVRSEPTFFKIPGARELIKGAITSLMGKSTPGSKSTTAKSTSGGGRISVVEVSISTRDAIVGVKKTIEISEPEGPRKVSVRVPPGSRTGSVVHLRSTHGSKEELVLIVRVASHPFISLQQKGVVIEVPITVSEAVEGANITVPTLEDPIVLKVPSGSQSGLELRVKDRGVTHRDGARGDLFYRLMIRVPEIQGARPDLVETARKLASFGEKEIRANLPRSLI